MKALWILLLAVGWISQQPEAIDDGEAKRPVVVSAILKPSRVVHLATPVDGVVAEVAADRGDAVGEGQVLARLDLSVQKAALEVAKAKVELEANLLMARATLEDSQRKLDQHVALHKKGVLSTEILDRIRTEHGLAVLAVQEAEEQRRLAKLEYERLRVALEQGVIKSPVRGVVAQRFLHPGELASRSGQAVLFQIVCLDPLHVEAHVPVQHFDRIKTGQSASVEVDAPESYRLSAKIVVVDPIVDTASETFGVRLELPNGENKLPAGLPCRILFQP